MTSKTTPAALKRRDYHTMIALNNGTNPTTQCFNVHLLGWGNDELWAITINTVVGLFKWHAIWYSLVEIPNINVHTILWTISIYIFLSMYASLWSSVHLDLGWWHPIIAGCAASIGWLYQLFNKLCYTYCWFKLYPNNIIVDMFWYIMICLPMLQHTATTYL